MKKTLATNLTEKQKDEFCDLFYESVSFNDCITPSPFGLPWEWGSPIELEGETIEEMVENFIYDYSTDIDRYEKEEKAREENENLLNILWQIQCDFDTDTIALKDGARTWNIYDLVEEYEDNFNPEYALPGDYYYDGEKIFLCTTEYIPSIPHYEIVHGVWNDEGEFEEDEDYEEDEGE